MERRIADFQLDPDGDWVAELDCGHDQHVRHRPPFQQRPWVLEEEGRAAHVATVLDCPLCERCELPVRVRFVRRGPQWDSASLPSGVRGPHALAAGRWGRLVVEAGRVAFHAHTSPETAQLLESGASQPIPPEVEHTVAPDSDALLFVELFDVVHGARRGGSDGAGAPLQGPLIPAAPDRALDTEPLDTEFELDEGGDPACWAHLLCPECGATLGGGQRVGHAEGCPEGDGEA